MVRVRGLRYESVGAVGAKGYWGSETSVGADEHGAWGRDSGVEGRHGIDQGRRGLDYGDGPSGQG